MRARWRTLLTVALMAITVLLAVAVAMIDRGIGVKDYAYVVMFASSFAFLGLVGGLLTMKRPENVLGWLLLLGSLGVVVGVTADTAYTAYAGPGAPVTTAVLVLAVGAWVPGAVALLVVVPLIFPTGRAPSPRWRWVGWLGAAAGAVVIAGVLEGAVRHPDLLTKGWEVLEAELGGSLLWRLSEHSWPVMLLAAVLAWASVVVRFRRSRGVERQQLKWFVFAIALTVSYTIFSNTPTAAGLPWLDVAAGAVALPAPGIAIGVAVLRYRLYDIDRIISRTLSYAVVAGLLSAVFASVAIGLPQLLSLPGESPLLVAVSTLAVAALFNPLRHRVQVLVDRRFNRARYDAARTVEACASRLRDKVDIGELSGELVGAATAALQPARVSVWLRQEPSK